MGNLTEGKCWFVTVAAKGIQDYIFRSDKLRDMIGGSELIESLVGSSLLVEEAFASLLDIAAHELGLKIIEGGAPSEMKPTVIALTRAGGGARLLFSDEQQARHFLTIWPLLVNRYAPGLELVAAIETKTGTVVDVVRKAEQQAAFNRNRLHPQFPVAGPLVQRNRQVGLPVTTLVGSEALDAETARRREIRKERKSRLLQRLAPEEFGTEEEGDGFRWPQDFEEMVSSERTYLAVVHADVSGLGKMVMKLGEHLTQASDQNAIAIYQTFSRMIAEAAETAIKTALKGILTRFVNEAKELDAQGRPEDALRVYPVRPIICAGDDLTLILRADLALGFTETFLVEFEMLAAGGVAGLQSSFGIKGLDEQPLTACAGIAFVKKSFPFSQSYALCASLCKFAKEAVDRQASAIAFDRVTASVALDYANELKRNLTLGPEGDKRVLTMNPYTVGKYTKKGAAASCPELGSLKQLLNAAQGLPRGSLRSLLEGVYDSTLRFDEGFERFREVAHAKGNSNAGAREAITKFDAALENLTGGKGDRAAWQIGTQTARTPLMDLLELQAVGIGKEEEHDA